MSVGLKNRFYETQMFITSDEGRFFHPTLSKIGLGNQVSGRRRRYPSNERTIGKTHNLRPLRHALRQPPYTIQYDESVSAPLIEKP